MPHPNPLLSPCGRSSPGGLCARCAETPHCHCWEVRDGNQHPPSDQHVTPFPPPPPRGLRPTVSWGGSWRPEPRGRPPGTILDWGGLCCRSPRLGHSSGLADVHSQKKKRQRGAGPPGRIEARRVPRRVPEAVRRDSVGSAGVGTRDGLCQRRPFCDGPRAGWPAALWRHPPPPSPRPRKAIASLKAMMATQECSGPPKSTSSAAIDHVPCGRFPRAALQE